LLALPALPLREARIPAMTARVLVVDDIAANVKLLGARLTAEYFEVLSASSGQQAIDICAKERVDVVLLDVMMPGMDGFGHGTRSGIRPCSGVGRWGR
jgi:PleD family two-component response regulator